jgi:succinyl-diaminopimelate desuccinylase
MSGAIDPVELAKRLIACPSITPATGEVFDVLEEALASIGFEVHRFTAGEAPDGPVENLFAARGTGSPHFAFAGHLDVVPPGEGWTGAPFEPEIRGGLLHGRGAVDMKGGIAAFVGACADVRGHPGTISLIITGDEEGPATYGTPRLMEWMAARGIRPDMILIGEPTSEARLGDVVKIGRRGSVNMWIDVPGTQGHVAYPHRADNPVPKLARVLAALDALHLDDGSEAFQPSNLEVTAVETSSKATNVIPGRARIQLNVRFNNLQRGEDLVALVRRTAEGGGARRDGRGEDFRRSLPDACRADLRDRARSDPRGDGRRAQALDPWRNVRRTVPDRALPRRRLRPSERDHAQARRGRGGGGYKGRWRGFTHACFEKRSPKAPPLQGRGLGWGMPESRARDGRQPPPPTPSPKGEGGGHASAAARCRAPLARHAADAHSAPPRCRSRGASRRASRPPPRGSPRARPAGGRRKAAFR